MTPEELVQEKIEQEKLWLDERVRASITAIEHDYGPDLEYRAYLARWRAERLDLLEAALRAAANRLS